MSCSRRNFILEASRLVLAGTCTALLPALLQSCGSPRLLRDHSENGMITLQRNQLGNHGYVLVEAEGLPAPLYVGRQAGQDFTAVLMLCTHKACQLDPAGNFLTCPCHGSEFSAAGKRMKAPAQTDLKTYRVSEDEQHVFIHLF